MPVAADGAAYGQYGAGAPTPPDILLTLAEAFGAELVGETGYEIAAAKCTSASEKAKAQEDGLSLLYGEMLPDGVSKILLPHQLGGALPAVNGSGSSGGGLVLELGSGSGKVALQTFLQCPGVRRVMGVELVSSRHAIAEAAMLRLCAALPNRFRISSHKAGESICVEETVSGRLLEFHCADFFVKGLDAVEQCDAIFFAVHIPCRLFGDLCKRLAKVKEGCRLFTYHSLDSIWWVDQPCPFQQCEANVPETDTFSTSWSPQGFRFHVYVCNRAKSPQIVPQPRNETYSEWKAIFDEKSQSHYFHNEENECSQWEIPQQAGCWHAVFAEDHKAYYFWHEPTNHAQWEVPKCMGDLGWLAQ